MSSLSASPPDPFAIAFSRKVLEILKQRKRQKLRPWNKAQLANAVGCDRVALSRLIEMEDRCTDDATFRRDGYKRYTSEIMGRIAQLLNISLDEVLMSVMFTSDTTNVIDLEYVRKQARESRFRPDWIAWEMQLQDLYRHKGLPIRAVIVPTQDDSRASNEQKLQFLGQTAAAVLHQHIVSGDSRRILCGLGKHVNALVQAVPVNPQKNNELRWLPAMPTYQGLDHFSANSLCSILEKKLGGRPPIELAATGYVEVGDEDAVDHFLRERSHLSLFGYEGDQESGLPRRGLAHSADTAILGCGIAAPGNPLWESPNRLRDAWQLRAGDWQAPGDVNGHYVVVRQDGEGGLLPEDPGMPGPENEEASSANYRALGARPSVMHCIAERSRRESRESGVIMLANTPGRAPLVYTALETGLVNTIIMDYECAEALINFIRIVEDKSSVFRALPERHLW